MKIELNGRSKIVGTYLVRVRGVVRCQSEFVGKEVRVILLPEPEQKREATTST